MSGDTRSSPQAATMNRDTRSSPQAAALNGDTRSSPQVATMNEGTRNSPQAVSQHDRLDALRGHRLDQRVSGQKPTLTGQVDPIITPKTSARGTPTPSNQKLAQDDHPPSQGSSKMEEALLQAEADMNIQPQADVRSHGGATKGEDPIDGFFPFRDLYKTAITIKCGPQLDEKDDHTVHLELLSCFSPKIANLFKKAEDRAAKYKRAVSLRKRVKALFALHCSAETFSQDKAHEAMRLVHSCLTRYPLQEHQFSLNENLAKFADKYLFTNAKMTRIPPSTGGLKKKEFREQDFAKRFQSLNLEGIQSLAHELLLRMLDIKAKEVTNAHLDPVKAAAQRTLILGDFEHETVGAVVHWLYAQTLEFENTKRLCLIYDLARELGIRDLAQICVNKLWSTAWDKIQDTKAQGSSVSTLLEIEPTTESGCGPREPLAGVVREVFMYVLQSSKPPPAILEDLVINTIAESDDPDLYDRLKPMLSHDLSLKLNHVLIKRLIKVKTEMPETKSLAGEKHHTKPNSGYKVDPSGVAKTSPSEPDFTR